MSKVDVKIVIGSNYGDEGKGLATHYFSQQSSIQNRHCLNVLYNGGSQRGHTVELKDGTRHVFHHLGSGTFDNADTYFDRDFLVDPSRFMEELVQLRSSTRPVPKCFISPKCRVVTPYDIFVNQIVELSRDKSRHGSCGCGIWETQQRYKNSRYNLSFHGMTNLSHNEQLVYLEGIRDYAIQKLKAYGVSNIPEAYRELFTSDGLIQHYLYDLHIMQSFVEQSDFAHLRDRYNTIVFEAGQGLALDEGNIEAYPHVTASKTGSKIPLSRIRDMPCDIEVCYVTRAYFTRHGAGNFPTECSTFDIETHDQTNVFNPFQESIRYGSFCKQEFDERVLHDKAHVFTTKGRSVQQQVTFSMFVTHLNVTGNIIGDCKLQDLYKNFSKTYCSDTRFSEDIRQGR